MHLLYPVFNTTVRGFRSILNGELFPDVAEHAGPAGTRTPAGEVASGFFAETDSN